MKPTVPAGAAAGAPKAKGAGLPRPEDPKGGGIDETM